LIKIDFGQNFMRLANGVKERDGESKPNVSLVSYHLRLAQSDEW
jgi:hypothetical protein